MKYFFLLLLLSGIALGCSSNRTAFPPEQQPNILFVISDDQSFQHTSFQNSPFVQTPAFDKLAENGVYFTNAVASSPGCAPARGALVTGRHHWQNEQSGQHAASWFVSYRTFIDELELHGYQTGRTGKGVFPFRYAQSETDTLRRKTDAGGINHSKFSYESGNDPRPTPAINDDHYVRDFTYFLDSVRTSDEPFFFWFGAEEPHRKYQQGSWEKAGKSPASVSVPSFYPDAPIIREDLLDYAVEIEWYDQQLGDMIEALEARDELDNTIIIITSDNGMPFPRAKANAYEYGIHVPFVIHFPARFPGNRIVTDVIGFNDLAPTVLDICSIKPSLMKPFSGRSFLDVLNSDREGLVDETRQYAFSGRERHSSSRYKNLGYPQRAIRSQQYLLIWNAKPELWPAGAPQRYAPDDSTKLWPLYGIGSNNRYIPDGAFADVDDSPTKTFLIEHHNQPEIRPFFDLAFGKRPEFELFDIKNDPGNLNNLAGEPAFNGILKELKKQLFLELERTGDPRITQDQFNTFDTYPRYSRMRYFPKLEHHE